MSLAHAQDAQEICLILWLADGSSRANLNLVHLATPAQKYILPNYPDILR